MSAPFVAPTWVTELEISAAPLQLSAPPRAGRPYGRIRCVVRRDGEPVGSVDMALHEGRVESAAIRAALPALPAQESEPVPWRPMTVAICTRERPASLTVALRSVLCCDPAPLEVIVIDSAPTTNSTVEVIEGLADHRLRLVREPRPGLSRARNRAVAEARGELIAFTDDDVRVDRGWLLSLARGFARAEHVGCVTGAVQPAELETPAQLYFDQKVGWTGAAGPRLYDLHAHRLESPLYPYLPGTFGAGANFAATAHALAAVGAFDEALGAGSPAAGGEDLDFFLRVLRADMAIAHEPSALVWHFHRRDMRTLSRQMVGYGSGLSALASKELLSPQTAPGAIRRIPVALRRLRRLPTRGATVSGDRSLKIAEIRGIAAGPWRYTHGRLAAYPRERGSRASVDVVGHLSTTRHPKDGKQRVSGSADA